MANLFDEDEIIIDRDMFTLLDKAEKVIKDKKVDDYTRKALEKVKTQHTYINRIEQLFSYLQ
jgi:spore maturation protein CgeB